jgi:drug/metabolite transporter (DMT)-like permease
VPFAAAGLGWLVLGQRPSRAAILASVAALVGATVMVGLSSDGTAPGDALAALNVVVGACMIVIARANPGMPTLAAATVSAVWAPLACLPFAGMALIDPATLGILFAFGLINTTAALAMFIIGSRHLAPVKTALISALETPLTPFWVWLAFAEVPSVATLSGGVIVFAAVVWYVVHEARQTARPIGPQTAPRPSHPAAPQAPARG